MANELLKQAVAHSHAAGDGDVGADRAGELDESEEARPAAVDFGDATNQPHDLGDDEHDVEDRARADRGHERHALRGGGDLAFAFSSRGCRRERSVKSMRSRPSMIARAASSTCARARAISGRLL